MEPLERVTTPTVLLLAPMAKVPPATLTPVVEGSVSLAPTMSEPPVILVSPLYVLEPLTVRLPEADLVNAVPVAGPPLITPERSVAPPLSTLSVRPAVPKAMLPERVRSLLPVMPRGLEVKVMELP